MQLSNQGMQTLRKTKNIMSISRAKSLDTLQHTQLTPAETKILLALPKQPSFMVLQNHIAKQDILIKKRLFDPHKYFGSPQLLTYDDSSQFHQKRLNGMFPTVQAKTQRKNSSKGVFKINEIRIDDNPLFTQGKGSEISNQATRRTVSRSPKSYVKQNKQNFQKLNINNMQKVRLKLKIGKK